MSILSSISGGALASLSGGRPTASGLISGLDTNKIIQGLLAIDQAKITRIDTRASQINQQQTAFAAVEANLLAVQGSLTQLAAPRNGLFDSRTATSSDPNSLGVAASGSAPAGVYQLHINQLAQANQIASQGFDATSSAVTHGTLQIKIGDTTTTITVDSSNDTLQGLANTINSSGAAVAASIVNDGSGAGQQGFRLLLASKATGIANRVVLTNNLADSSGNAVKPLLDVGTISSAIAGGSNTGTSAAQTNGGAGYSGNANNLYTFTVVQGGTVGTDDGVQLSYTDANGTNTGTITLNQGDVDTLQNVAQGIQIQFAAGTLSAGDTFQVKAFVPNVQDAADASVTLGSGSGALTVTSATNQIDTLLPGVALSLLASDPTKAITVSVVNNTDGMKTGIKNFVSSFNSLMNTIDTQTRYDAASQTAAPLLGNQQVLTIQDRLRSSITNAVAGVNPKLSHIGALGITLGDNGQLVVDDTKLSAALSGGVSGVTLDDVRRFFTLTGTTTNQGFQYVSASSKTVASATPYTVHITQAGDNTHDVVGYFVVNGVTETAHGSGQFLIGDSTNANTADLQVRVTLTADEVGAGAQADVTVMRGIASRLNDLLTSTLDPINGRLKLVADTFQQSLTDLADQKTAQTNLLNAHQANLEQQFAAMEQTLAQLQSASNFITAQQAELLKKQ